MATEKNKVQEIQHTRQQYMQLCVIQSTLREVGLYKGAIDGWFGRDSFDAFEYLTGEPVQRSGSWMARDVFFALQRNLCIVGQCVPMDGVWGDESKRAYLTLWQRYHRNHHCMTYGPAWSRRSEITPEDWVQMKQWLIWNGRSLSHLSYLTSVIAYETEERFYRTSTENEFGPDEKPLSLRQYLTLYFQLLSSSRRIELCHTFDHYALVSQTGYPVTYDSRTQPDGLVVSNPVGVADGYLWDGLHPINRVVSAGHLS